MADSNTLQVDEVVGGLPGGVSNLSPPVAGQPLHISADAAKEYVAGQRLQWYINLPHALPWAFDDVGVEFGADIYERMLTDAQVRSTINVLKAGILEDGINLSPAIDDEDEDGYDEAVKLVEQAEAMFDELTNPLDDVLWDMLDAIALGNRVAEQTYRLEGNEYVLETLAPRPRESTAFVIDAYMRVIGILGRIPGQPFGVQQGMLLATIQETANLLPRSKFAVFSWRPRNGDPRGSAVLRAAFDPWNQKQQLKREFLKYLTQFASPSLVGYTAENAQEYQPIDPLTGLPKVDANGHPVTATPEQNMVDALTQFANGTATAFPYGSKVQPIEMSSQGGNPFLAAFNHCDKQITKAVLQQTLATEESEHQARASTETQKDVLDTLTRQGKRPLERMLRNDVLKVWLLLNKGEKLLPLLPTVSLGESEQEDWSKLWTAAAALNTSGYLHSSQYAELDTTLGLPQRDPSDASTPDEKILVTAKADASGPVQVPAGQQTDVAFSRVAKKKRPKNKEVEPAKAQLKKDLDATFEKVWGQRKQGKT